MVFLRSPVYLFYLHQVVETLSNTRGITSVTTCTTTLTSHLETSGDISLIQPGRGETRGDCQEMMVVDTLTQVCTPV